MKATVCILFTLGLTAGAYADSITHGSTTIVMEFVDIGDAGNPADTSIEYNGANPGSVPYNYRIGKYEVTIDEFTKANNADNRIGDGNENYWNISPRTAGDNAPAHFVSWTEAAMFCNWLTSGDATLGAYSVSNGVLTAVDRYSARTKYMTTYVISTEDEWHKAAYYTGNPSDYWSGYANGTDVAPVQGFSGANYHDVYKPNGIESAWAVGSGAVEQNGTYDMMGNEFEWMESTEDGVLDDIGENRATRGGSISSVHDALHSNSRYHASFESVGYGFRVVSLGNYNDDDRDKMYDDWEIEHFGSIANCQPGDDPDEDGYSNLEEFNNKTDPNVADIYTLLWTAVEVGWKSQSGTNYQVQCSTDLSSNSWENVGSSVVGDGLTNTVFNSTRDAGQKFYRVITAP